MVNHMIILILLGLLIVSESVYWSIDRLLYAEDVYNYFIHKRVLSYWLKRLSRCQYNKSTSIRLYLVGYMIFSASILGCITLAENELLASTVGIALIISALIFTHVKRRKGVDING